MKESIRIDFQECGLLVRLLGFKVLVNRAAVAFDQRRH
jgi:hypothetical protein